MEQNDKNLLSHGRNGVFSLIETNANRFSANCLILLALVAIVLVSLASIVDKSEYMHEVRISMSVLVALCLLVGGHCLVRRKQSRVRKYVLCFAWFVSLLLAVTFIDSSVMLLYAIPVLLAIRYNSVVYTIFVSLFNIIFAFFPYLINSYRRAFPLDFVVLRPGTVITMTSNSLDGTVNALGDQILRSETIINMLTYGYLATALFLLIISAIAVSFTMYNRKLILEQYRQARNSLGE